ncbi:hypothetical protein M5K25_024563 [Dendrobium thyrsiflorum]|uniref:Uncharacterized protein n=1 Tax=Dendrobium thyrsiflorum TaxID=117978 RepID=A0ABD0U2K9_DENTH
MVSLDLSVESPIITIRASLLNLRPHLFYPRILHGLGSLFGQPLRIDNATYVGSHPSVAQILFELDITKYYPDVVWIGLDNLGYVQSIVMEDLPSFCDHCKALGHDNKECGILNLGSSTVNIVSSDGNVNDVLETMDNVVIHNLTLVSPVNALVANASDCIETFYDMVKIPGDLYIGNKVGIIEEETAPLNIVLHLPIVHVDCEDVNDSLGPNNFRVNLKASPISSPYVGGSAFAQPGVNSMPFGMETGEDDGSPMPSSDADSLPFNGNSFIDVPISIISNDVLKAKLSLNMEDTCMDTIDWLVGSDFAPCGGVGNDLGEPVDEFHAMYSLNVDSIVEKIFSRKGGKRGRRKSKLK